MYRVRSSKRFLLALVLLCRLPGGRGFSRSVGKSNETTECNTIRHRRTQKLFRYDFDIYLVPGTVHGRCCRHARGCHRGVDGKTRSICVHEYMYDISIVRYFDLFFVDRSIRYDSRHSLLSPLSLGLFPRRIRASLLKIAPLVAPRL